MATQSAEQDALLPVGATLTLQSHSGDVVQFIAARDYDNGIQLKRFRCSTGTQFSLQVSLQSASLTETFLI